jgi:hypothetical protein
MTAAKPSISKRRSTMVIGAWALGTGIPLALIGWWLRQPLMWLGVLCAGLGVIWLLTSRLTSNDPITGAHRRYLRAFFPAMGAYVVAIFVYGYLRDAGLPVWARVLTALLPVLPIAWVVVSLWRYVRGSDELEQRVQIESIYITCGVVGVASFFVGMLESAGVVQLSSGLILVLPAMFLVYGVVGWWCRRKYGLSGVC